jgi:hypothetical protein
MQPSASLADHHFVFVVLGILTVVRPVLDD